MLHTRTLPFLKSLSAPYSIAQRGTLLTTALLLSACGGGGGGGGGAVVNTSPTGTWTPGVYAASSTFAARCASPRSGIDAITGVAYADKSGSSVDEKNWLRSWTHELYLWYREVPDTDPRSGVSVLDYFDALKTSQTTASGSPKDQFHFTYTTAEWEQLSLNNSQSGYGAQWALLASRPPRQLLVAYTEPNTPATTANLVRGTEVLIADGVDVVNANDQASVDALNAAVFPSAPGQTHTFTVRNYGSTTTRNVTLTSATITSVPVQNVHTINTTTGVVGYMLFNDHLASAEQQLITAFTTLANAGVTDLVLDIRYNGGGYLDIASELAYMVAGPAATANKTFEALQFNDQHPSTNPVTGGPLTPTPFHTTAQGFSASAGQPLPTLNLTRVFVLTGNGTCSASEAIINGLRGVNVDVIQVGSVSCGKPYGFYATENCGTTYFSIQFKGVNAKGFGDYSDGFAPNNSSNAFATKIPGCSVGDDFGHALGNSAESRLSAALNYRLTQTCPGATGVAGQTLLRQAVNRIPESDTVMTPKSPWLENRIFR